MPSEYTLLPSCTAPRSLDAPVTSRTSTSLPLVSVPTGTTTVRVLSIGNVKVSFSLIVPPPITLLSTRTEVDVVVPARLRALEEDEVLPPEQAAVTNAMHDDGHAERAATRPAVPRSACCCHRVRRAPDPASVLLVAGAVAARLVLKKPYMNVRLAWYRRAPSSLHVLFTGVAVTSVTGRCPQAGRFGPAGGAPPGGWRGRHPGALHLP